MATVDGVLALISDDSMNLAIDLRSEVLDRRVTALDYRFGQHFFDLSGHLTRRILQDSTGWVLQRHGNSGSQLFNSDSNLTFTFGADRMVLSQSLTLEMKVLTLGPQFGAEAERLFTHVIETLDLTSFSRIGYQVNCLYPTADSAESQRRLSDLRLMAMPASAETAIGAVTDASRTLVVDRPDNSLRIVLAAFEQDVKMPPSVVDTAARTSHSLPKNQRQALWDALKAKQMIKTKPKFGVSLELDSFITDPEIPDQLSICDFITTADQDIIELKKIILLREDK